MKMLVIFCLVLTTTFAEVINTRGLKENDLIEWKGTISSRAAPALLYIYSPFIPKRHYSVLKMEVQGVRNNLAFSTGISGKESKQSFSSGNGRGSKVCSMGRTNVAPGMKFRAIIRVLRSRLMIYWNGKLAFTFTLTKRYQRIDKVFQIRIFGSAETKSLKLLSDEDLAKEMQDPECGRVTMGLQVPQYCPQRQPLLRIVGGVTAKPGLQPWQAALRRKTPSPGQTGHVCGATLIGKCWAVTAAHCLPSVSKSTLKGMVIRVGDYYNRDNTEHSRDPTAEDSEDLEIEKVIRHSAFRQYPSSHNDIALIKLKDCATYSDFVKPACLPKSKNQFTSDNSICSVSGWGASQERQRPNDFPACLKTTYVKIKKNMICNASYGQDLFQKESMLCAGGLGGGDSCNGDSGGPMICFEYSPRKKFTLWGITSWGNGCGIRSQPGVYTRLSSYTRWMYRWTKLSPDDDAVVDAISLRLNRSNGFCFNQNSTIVN